MDENWCVQTWYGVFLSGLGGLYGVAFLKYSDGSLNHSAATANTIYEPILKVAHHIAILK